jgi:hypothetical protein
VTVTLGVIQVVPPSSEYSKVVRYVTGSPDVDWPVGSMYWIKKNVEVEAPAATGDKKEAYQNFHIIKKIYAYDDDALNDAEYSHSLSNLSLYTSNNIGAFSTKFANYIPALKEFTSTKQCVMNPTFGDSSKDIGGADADIIIDDTIIHVNKNFQINT